MVQKDPPSIKTISIALPHRKGVNGGNGRTAERYERFLREAGFRVDLVGPGEEPRGEVLIALHARRSLETVSRFRSRVPVGGCCVVLTGTDLYQDLPQGSLEVREGMEKADLLVGLHPGVYSDVPEEYRAKLRVLVQSSEASPFRVRPEGLKAGVKVALVPCNLREVKDPLLPARASGLLPSSSQFEVFLVGEELEAGWEERTRKEERENPRFHWLGGRPHQEALALIAGSDVVVIPSKSEGAANVLSEAIACGVPVLGTDIPGNRGILGEEPGPFFPVGDEEGLAGLLLRFENDPAFRKSLAQRVLSRKNLVSPQKEKEGLLSLAQELGASLPLGLEG